MYFKINPSKLIYKSHKITKMLKVYSLYNVWAIHMDPTHYLTHEIMYN